LCLASPRQGAPLNEADHCGDPPLLLAAGNGAPACRRAARARAVCSCSKLAPKLSTRRRAGHLAIVKLLLEEGADIQQAGVVRSPPARRSGTAADVGGARRPFRFLPHR
jgi:hypothetical protein